MVRTDDAGIARQVRLLQKEQKDEGWATMSV